MAIHDNPLKSTCPCNAYTDKHQAGAINFWRKRKLGNFKRTKTAT